MELSKRITKLPVSAVRRLTPYGELAAKEGVKIYHLNIGDPDIETPYELINVLHNWKSNPIRYSPSKGEPKFLEAMAKYYNTLSKTKIAKENIVATVGGSEAISMVLYSIANPDEEVLVFEPFYSNYASFAAINGVKLIPIPADFKNGFHLPNQKMIEQKISKRTKAILFCSPGNPTGAVYSKSELEMLVTIAKKHNLFLVSDEVYREYVFDKKIAPSLLTFFPKILDRAIIVDSLSKRYSLCGARLGTVVSLNTDLIASVTKIAQSRLSAGFIEQNMAVNLESVKQSYFEKVRNEYKKRRDVLYEGLKKIPRVKVYKPEGAFYLMVGLPVKNAEKFCIYLLKDFRLSGETVMLAPGNGFYLSKGKGLNEVRIAYVLNVNDLKKCLQILAAALKEYKD